WLAPRLLERVLSYQHQADGFERLFDEVVGALLDRGDRRFDVAVPRNHDDRQFGVLRFHRIEQLQAIKPAALQPDIEEDQTGPAARNVSQRVVAVTRRARDVAFVLQNAGNEFPDI